jgi:2-acylglycerol O-acyltransferase 2
LHDKGSATRINNPQVDNNDDAILAFVPHGIFPFALAFSCLPQRGYEETWGVFRPVVATATKLFPLVRTFIAWMGGIDASRSAVSSALNLSESVGIAPGGIAEMFETYPKPGFHRNDEAFRVRNGIFKLAVKHNRPIIPIYCFGATKMLRRVQLPTFIENLSRMLKISLCLFFGKLGLPIPFRQRLMYVMGKTIYPPINNTSGELLDQQAQEMHHRFCDEIIRIFENNKEHYGWGNKMIRLV